MIVPDSLPAAALRVVGAPHYIAEHFEQWRAVVRDLLSAQMGVSEDWHARGSRWEPKTWLLPVPVDGVVVWLCLVRGVVVVAARAPALRGLWINMRPGHLYVLDKLGVRDEIIGHAAFDDRFIVKTNDLRHARAWLDERACAYMANTLRYRFEANRTWVRALVYDGVPVESEVPTVVRAVGALASTASLEKRWSAAAEGLGARVGRPRDDRDPHGPMRLDIDGVAAELDTCVEALGRRKRAARLFTRVGVARLNPGGTRFVTYDHGRMGRGQRPSVRGLDRVQPKEAVGQDLRYRWYGGHEGIWPRAAQTAFLDAGPTALVGDRRRVTAYFAGFVDDSSRLGAAARLCRTLAVDVARHGTAGPYR